jgi:choline-sulfatase
MKSRPPNILFLMTDQHRADCLGFAGNPVVRTPHLDRLAATATVFHRAYTPSPICVPSRQAIMSGLLPSHCNCEEYGQDLAPGSMTWSRRLSQHAYQTVACGKLHHMGVDQLQGWNRLIGMHENLDASYIPDRDPEAFHRLLPHQSLAWDPTKEVLRSGVGKGRGIQHDHYAVQGALHYIEEHFTDTYYDRATPDRPLCLKVSLEQPHIPFLAEDEASFAYYLNRVSIYDEPLFDHPAMSHLALRREDGVTPRDLRRMTAAYYAMIEAVDGHFGQVLHALEQVGQNLDDWIIVFTSDHGEMLGQKGVIGKRKFFEGSVRVPLFIRWPKHYPQARAVQENVSLCDLFATLCELTQTPCPSGLDSRSLVPLMEGRTQGWKNEALSQFKSGAERSMMVLRDNLKYQSHGTKFPELLFDLAADPLETQNILHHPKHSGFVSECRAKLKAEFPHYAA